MIPAILGFASGSILLLSRGEEESVPIATGLDHSQDGIEVPLGLTRNQWIAFLKVATCGNPRTVSPSFRLGVFGFHVRRLCDLGAMTDPKVIQYNGRQVWDGHWLDPGSLAAFQSAPMVQYRLFAESMKRYHTRPEVIRAIGQFIDGSKVSQSGALMLAHRAGLSGMQSWLADPGIRLKFRDNTTAFFEKANGIF